MHVSNTNDSLSYTPPNYNPAQVDIWTMKLKPGMRFQFADLMKKWKGLWDAKKYPFSMRVFYNDLFTSTGKDAAVVYSFDKFAEFDLDISWRNDYEALYG